MLLQVQSSSGGLRCDWVDCIHQPHTLRSPRSCAGLQQGSIPRRIPSAESISSLFFLKTPLCTVTCRNPQLSSLYPSKTKFLKGAGRGADYRLYLFFSLWHTRHLAFRHCTSHIVWLSLLESVWLLLWHRVFLIVTNLLDLKPGERAVSISCSFQILLYGW